MFIRPRANNFGCSTIRLTKTRSSGACFHQSVSRFVGIVAAMLHFTWRLCGQRRLQLHPPRECSMVKGRSGTGTVLTAET